MVEPLYRPLEDREQNQIFFPLSVKIFLVRGGDHVTQLARKGSVRVLACFWDGCGDVHTLTLVKEKFGRAKIFFTMDVTMTREHAAMFVANLLVNGGNENVAMDRIDEFGDDGLYTYRLPGHQVGGRKMIKRNLEFYGVKNPAARVGFQPPIKCRGNMIAINAPLHVEFVEFWWMRGGKKTFKTSDIWYDPKKGAGRWILFYEPSPEDFDTVWWSLEQIFRRCKDTGNKDFEADVQLAYLKHLIDHVPMDWAHYGLEPIKTYLEKHEGVRVRTFPRVELPEEYATGKKRVRRAQEVYQELKDTRQLKRSTFVRPKTGTRAVYEAPLTFDQKFDYAADVAAIRMDAEKEQEEVAAAYGPEPFEAAPVMEPEPPFEFVAPIDWSDLSVPEFEELYVSLGNMLDSEWISKKPLDEWDSDLTPIQIKHAHQWEFDDCQPMEVEYVHHPFSHECTEIGCH